MTDLSVPPVSARAGRRRQAPAPRAREPGRGRADARARRHPRARRRFRRSLFPALALRELEPGGGHRQVGGVQHRSRRRRARRRRRQAGVRVLRRHFPRGARRGRVRRARDRPAGPVGFRAALRAVASRARSIPRRSRREPRGGAEGRAARAARAQDAGARPAGRAGDGVDLRRARDDPHRAQRRPDRRRRPSARPPLDHGDRRGERPPRARLCGRRRALRLRLLRRRAASTTSRSAPSTQALTNLAARPAPAGTMTVVLGNGWPGILLHEAIGHGLEGDFNRKETSAFSGRVGEQVATKGITVVDDGTMDRRRGSLNLDDEGNPTQRTVLIEDGILRGYMQDRLNAGLMGVARHRQRPPRVVRAPADAPHDEHADARGRARPRRDHRVGEARPLREEFRRRAGRHHERQVRVLRGRGVHDRGRQGDPCGEGRDADRQRPRRAHARLDGRQRPGARPRHRHLRQGRPERPGRRRPAHAQDRRPHGRRYRLTFASVQRCRLRQVAARAGAGEA